MLQKTKSKSDWDQQKNNLNETWLNDELGALETVKEVPDNGRTQKKRATTKQPAHGENLNLLVASTGFVIVAQLYYKDRYKCPRSQGDHGNSGSHVYNRRRLTNIHL